MPPQPPGIWTFSRRLAGNLLPLLISVPFFLWAMIELARNGVSWKVWVGAGGFSVLGWLSTNFLGLSGNGWMKRQMETRFRSLREGEDFPRFFVGFARPDYKGALDPHEDVGFLVLRPDALEFWGSELKFEMPWRYVKEVRTRANIHTLLGLGGWVSIEGEVGGKAVRMLVEPRERGTHWGNKRFRGRLLEELRKRISE